MLYNEGNLTEEQAERIIGEKMMDRINAVNEWLEENNYFILLHSTVKQNADDILSSEGLFFYNDSDVSAEEIMAYSNVKEKDIKSLEKWMRQNHSNGEIRQLYESVKPIDRDTVSGYKKLSAKLLLEYNHMGFSTTVVFCVPRKVFNNPGNIMLQEKLEFGITRRYDPYLRRKLIGTFNSDGSIKFSSQYFYPREGILFAYDRNNNKIKINSNYDEEYYIDDNCYKKDGIHKGELVQILKEAYSYGDTTKDGKTR